MTCRSDGSTDERNPAKHASPGFLLGARQRVNVSGASVSRRWDSCAVQSKPAAAALVDRAGRSACSAFAIAISASGSSSGSCRASGCAGRARRSCRSRDGARDAWRVTGGLAASRAAEGARTGARVVRLPFGRSGDAGDAVATRCTSGIAPASRGAGLGVVSRTGSDDPDGVAAGRAAMCCAGAMTGVAGSTAATRTMPADCVRCAGTSPAVTTASTGARPGIGSCTAINPPMIPSAPMLQQVACIARRSRVRPGVRSARRSAAPSAMAAMVGAQADAGCAAGSGCQRHARCGESTSMQDVVSVARPRLPGRAPDEPWNVHSRPNGGTPSSGATRGRARAPST